MKKLVYGIMCFAAMAAANAFAEGTVDEGASSEEELVIYRTIYVNPSAAKHVEPYATRETGAATLADAIACANASNWAAKIVMATGNYTGSGYTLSTPILVVGETGDPKDVSITDNSSSSASGSRAFLISHPFAGLSALTITGYGLNGSANDHFCGGHINMSAGVVDNCVITGGRGARAHSGGWGHGSGGNVYMSGGRLTRSKITGGQAIAWKQGDDVDSWRSYGGGVYATGDAVVDSCLIYGNGNETITYGGGICLDGRAVAVNCTVVDNTTDPTYPGAGICIYGANAKVVNCVMYGNGGTAKAEFGTANLDKYMCCASSVTNESCATWYLMGESAFMGYLVQDFRHNPSSSLTDHGTVSALYDDPIATDFFGNPRKSGPAYDIGYYEIDQSCISCSALPSTYGYFVGSNITFTASAVGGSGGYFYRFDFGNGVTVNTANAVYTYAYPAAGLYTVRVAASDDGGNTWGKWSDIPTQIVVAPAVMYVNSANASQEYPYDTPDKAAKKIADCLAAMTNNASANLGTIDGGTIRILAGPHAETGIKLTCGVTVRGNTGDPADVVIMDNTKSNATGERAFTITHPGAVVSDLTISGYGINGEANNNFCGGHINMSAGVVDNCVITGGRGARAHSGGWGHGSGGNVYMSGGRLTRSKITGGQAIAWKQGDDVDSWRSYGGGVYATGDAVVDSCLIYGNGNETITYGGGICLDGRAVAVNCTVVDNTTDPTYPGAGICIYGANAKVVNCVMYGNGGTAKAEFGTANLDKYMCCASSVTNESCATWYLMGESAFMGYLVQDFRHNPSSSLTDHGTVSALYDDPIATDFFGNPRKSGPAYDIGYYEIDQSCISCSALPSTYGYFVGSNITFTASAVGGSGGYLYRFDFGNGVTVDTANAVYTYAYPAAGLYTARVAASDDGGNTWSAWADVTTQIAIVPAVMYVNSANASPEYPYDTPAKAAKKIADCLAAMTNNASANLGTIDGGTIRVLTGTHPETGIKLVCAVTVCGDTGDPANVVINDSVNGSRAFTLSHAGAVVRDLTVSGTGYRTSIYAGTPSYGGHIYVSDGTVENCIVTGGYGANTHYGGWGRGFGGNIYLSGGRLTRSKITAGHGAGHMTNATDDNHTGRGGGVCAEGDAVVDSCLIYANGNESRTLGGGIYLGGSAVAVNCTIVDNATGPGVAGSGLYIGSSTARAVNCVMYGNGGTAVSEFGGVNPDRFAYCASAVMNESCATWKVVDETAFRDWSRRAEDTTSLRPRNGGVLVDAGSTGAEYEACGGTATEDLRGYERISGRRLDIGCYASRPRGSVYYLR